MDSATWCRTPAAASAARRLRPEVSKNSSTALSSNEGELARSITTCAPATASLTPSPVMVLTPLLGDAATTSWPPWRRMATVFEPIRPVPPMTTIFMVYRLLSMTGDLQMVGMWVWKIRASLSLSRLAICLLALFIAHLRGTCWQFLILYRADPMEAAYISTFAALAGTAIGGLTSFATSWMTQHAQARAQRLAAEREARVTLFGRFLEEAAKLYSDALQNRRDDIIGLISIYALTNRIRLTSSPQVVEAADTVCRIIIDAYLAPNITLEEMRANWIDRHVDPLRDFSEACRKELLQIF